MSDSGAAARLDSAPAADTGGDADDAPQSPHDGSPPDSTAPPSDAGQDAAHDAADSGGTDGAPDAGQDAAVSAGDALQFASGAYVNMGSIPIPSDFTIEAWVSPASTSGETDVVAQDRNGQAAGQFRFGITAGKLFFIMSDSTGNTHGLYASGYSLQTTQSLTVGAWSHVAVTKSGASFALFIGATLAASVTASAAFSYGGPLVAFRVAARVGTDGTSADSSFTGAIDEVRLWNVARSASEIAAGMSTTVSPADPTLLSYWRFDDGSGLTASDEKGGYPGTLVGGPVWIVSTAF